MQETAETVVAKTDRKQSLYCDILRKHYTLNCTPRNNDTGPKMSSPNSMTSRIRTLLARVVVVLLLPLTLPVLVATNYRGLADRLADFPGIRRGGGASAGVAVLAYIVVTVGLVGGTATLALDDGESGPVSTTNGTVEEAATADETPTSTPTATPRNGSTETPRATSTPRKTSIKDETGERNEYELLLSDINETYLPTAQNSYPGPYLSFFDASYNTTRNSVMLNFSMDDHDSVNRYERAVSGSAGVYIWSHFNPETAYPETVTLNYFRDGDLNATAEIKSQWMRQYMFGNVSPDSPAPMSYRTYVRVVMGTLTVNGEQTEFPNLLTRCEEENSINSGECKNSLRERMPVRFYLPERTETGGSYTNVMGNAQPITSFNSRQERLEYTVQKLEKNITGTVSIEGYTSGDEDNIWENVDMRIRDVYLENETIVVEQYTRSARGDDSLPLQQRDVVGAKYGRLVVDYGAEYMPANGVVIVQYTPDGQKYAKVRVLNYNAVGYINGERGLVELGLDIEIIERYQEPGS